MYTHSSQLEDYQTQRKTRVDAFVADVYSKRAAIFASLAETVPQDARGEAHTSAHASECGSPQASRKGLTSVAQEQVVEAQH